MAFFAAALAFIGDEDYFAQYDLKRPVHIQEGVYYILNFEPKSGTFHGNFITQFGRTHVYMQSPKPKHAWKLEYPDIKENPDAFVLKITVAPDNQEPTYVPQLYLAVDKKGSVSLVDSAQEATLLMAHFPNKQAYREGLVSLRTCHAPYRHLHRKHSKKHAVGSSSFRARRNVWQFLQASWKKVPGSWTS